MILPIIVIILWPIIGIIGLITGEWYRGQDQEMVDLVTAAGCGFLGGPIIAAIAWLENVETPVLRGRKSK